jgi:hypothetical protein
MISAAGLAGTGNKMIAYARSPLILQVSAPVRRKITDGRIGMLSLLPVWFLSIGGASRLTARTALSAIRSGHYIVPICYIWYSVGTPR